MQQIFNRKVIQKIMALLVILVLSNFIMSTRVYAADGTVSLEEIEELDDDEGSIFKNLFGVLLSPITSLFIGAGDGINWIMRTAIVGGNASDGKGYSVLISGDRAKKYMAENDGTDDDEHPTVYISKKGIDHSYGATYGISVIDYTPAEIFAGRISALNANFFKTDQEYDKLLGGENKSIVKSLRDVVSNWYVAIRNIAIVGLMSVLLYMGIRIVISSSANDKAKYKQMLVDWLVALCLIFFMHYIMAFTMTVSEQILKVFTNDEEGAISQCIIRLYEIDGNNVNLIKDRQWKSNFVNVARIKTQYDNLPVKLGYTALYIAFTGYTVYFTYVYFKRLLMLAFYTMIAPAVALTYPLDKIRDGKAQAFNFWLKDYIFYALLPVLHMLLYTVFVSSALDIASKNMLYAIFAMAFITPAEKIVKKMFHIQGNTEDRIGGFAGGAIASSLINAVKKRPPKGAPGGGQKDEKIPTIPSNSNSVDGRANMDSAKPWELEDKSQKDKEEKAPETAASPQVDQPNTSEQADTDSEKNINTQNSTPIEEPQDDNKDVDSNSNSQSQSQSQFQPQDTDDDSTSQQYYGNASMDPNAAKNPNENKVVRKLKNIPLNVGMEAKRRFKAAGGGRALASKVGRGLMAGAFGTAAAAAGVGLGIVGGDVSDVFKYAAAGFSAGTILGNKAGQAAMDTFTGKNAAGSFASNVLHGGYEENLRRKARKNYINNNDNLARIKEKHKEFKDNDKKAKEWAAREFDIQYATGTDNAKYADKALKMEDKYKEAYKAAGYSDEDAATYASQIAQGALARTGDWSKSELGDRTKREGYTEDLAEQYADKGVSKENARLYAEHEIDLTRMIYGQKEMKNIAVPKREKRNKAE